jgi:DNA-binding transcriptional ArsR family regulator
MLTPSRSTGRNRALRVLRFPIQGDGGGRNRARASRSSRRLRAVVTYNQMVVESEESKTDDVFHALADPTRRDILRRAGGDAPSVSRLADAYPMSFAAVQKHVAVLERAGLVTKRRRGREQLVEAAPEGLADARRALEGLEEIWRGRVERMSELLASDSEQDERKP